MRAVVEEVHGYLVAVRLGSVVMLAAPAAAHNLVDEGAEAVAIEGVDTAMEAAGSIAEDAAVPLEANTAGCYAAAVSAVVGGLGVVDMGAPI